MFPCTTRLAVAIIVRGQKLYIAFCILGHSLDPVAGVCCVGRGKWNTLNSLRNRSMPFAIFFAIGIIVIVCRAKLLASSVAIHFVANLKCQKSRSKHARYDTRFPDSIVNRTLRKIDAPYCAPPNFVQECRELLDRCACNHGVLALKLARSIWYVSRVVRYDAANPQNALRPQPADKLDIALVCGAQQARRSYR